MAIGPSDKSGKGDLSGTLGTTGSTRVDLGDDLLEATASDERTVPLRAPSPKTEPKAKPPATRTRNAPTAEEIHDRVQSARILFGEGLIDEAKKIARQVLIDDPPNAFASQLLAEIHKLELKQIFAGGPTRRNIYAPKEDEPEEDLSEVDSDGILHRLDQDLGLGFFDQEGAESAIAQLSIFSDPGEMDRFGDRVDRELQGTSLDNRLDVGIGFLEMGLYALAERQFRVVYRRARPSMAHLVSSTALLAYVLILSGHAFDASLVLQPVLKEHEVALKDKIELFYLMGRAQEVLNKPSVAAEWYMQVREHDPFYRDIQERLRRIDRRDES